MAIQATELRIGNLLISETGEVLPVAYILSDVIALDNGCGGVQKHQKNPIMSYDIELLKPIQITEEWLVRFKFEDFNGFYSIGFMNREKTFSFQRYDETQAEIWWRGRYFGICQRLQYVHQLQNLYFALTGEDLQLKE